MLVMDVRRQAFWAGRALRQAARQGRVEEVRALLASGTPPDCVSLQRHRLFRPWIHARPALWHAVANGHRAVVDVLLDHGADPNVIGWMSSTPLWTACCLGKVEMVVRLLEAGANPNLRGCRGSTPLLAWLGALAIPRAADRSYAPGADGAMEIGQLLNAAGASLDGLDEVMDEAAHLMREAGYPDALLQSAVHLQALRAQCLARILSSATATARIGAAPSRL